MASVALRSPDRQDAALRPGRRDGHRVATSSVRRGGPVACVLLSLIALTIPAQGQSLTDQRQRLATAKRDAAIAATRADALARQAAGERDAADAARAQEAALAARVVAAEANVAAARARQAIVARLLTDQQQRLGMEQAPVARLLAALTALARRPAMVAVAQPGSVDDLVHVRAVLGGALPLVRTRTDAVRGQIARTDALARGEALAAAALRQGRAQLEGDRIRLARLEADHRRRSQMLGRNAISESDRALALGERARDLVDSLDERDAAQATAADLAALPGPLPRPVAPGSIPPPAATGAYRLPVAGRLVTGFGAVSEAGVRARGLTFAVAPDTPVVAPAAGIVRYARGFRGYGSIVIIDHGDGWTSLVTGLGAVDVAPGARVAAGATIGRAARGEAPQVTVELRRRGRPMDIVALLG